MYDYILTAFYGSMPWTKVRGWEFRLWKSGHIEAPECRLVSHSVNADEVIASANGRCVLVCRSALDAFGLPRQLADSVFINY